jgi:hypothetical protein
MTLRRCPSLPPRSALAGFRFPPEVIFVAVRWKRVEPTAKIDLEVLTKSYDVPVRDDAGGEGKEGFVDVAAAFPAGA